GFDPRRWGVGKPARTDPARNSGDGGRRQRTLIRHRPVTKRRGQRRRSAPTPPPPPPQPLIPTNHPPPNPKTANPFTEIPHLNFSPVVVKCPQKHVHPRRLHFRKKCGTPVLVPSATRTGKKCVPLQTPIQLVGCCRRFCVQWPEAERYNVVIREPRP